MVEIGNYAFFGNNFKSLSVEQGNPRYDSLNYCNAIIETGTNTLIAGCQKTTIPNTATCIGEGAFQEVKMTSITIPNSVTSIGEAAFYGCGLTSLNLPSSVTTIAAYTFANNNFTALVIPRHITSIGEFAFEDCHQMTSLVFPNSLKTIGSYSFRDCTELKSIYIPNSVTNIDEAAFDHIHSNANVFVNKKYPTSVMLNGRFSWRVLNGMTLHVPVGTEEAYRNHTVWSEFGTIIGDLEDDVVGDVDGNGNVDVGDVNALVNIILNK